MKETGERQNGMVGKQPEVQKQSLDIFMAGSKDSDNDIDIQFLLSFPRSLCVGLTTPLP